MSDLPLARRMETTHFSQPSPAMQSQHTLDLSSYSLEEIHWAILNLLGSYRMHMDMQSPQVPLPPHVLHQGHSHPFWCSQPPLPFLTPGQDPACSVHPSSRPRIKQSSTSGQKRNLTKKTPEKKNNSTLRGWQQKNCILPGKKEDGPVMQNFRKNHLRFQLMDIRNNVVEFAKDQYGSRFIQQKLECVDSDQKQMIFAELTPEICQMMNHKYANYVIQKFFEFGSDEQKIVLVEKLQGNVLFLAFEVYGCRVIQKAVETLPPEYQAEIISELDGHMLECVKNDNGNHVIQKCIKWADPILLQSIVASIMGKFFEMAVHPCGCRVVQRILENCNTKLLQGIVDELLDRVHDLVLDKYGNYVIQHIIVQGSCDNRSRVIAGMQGHVCDLAQHKFASNVLEKCLVHGSPREKAQLIQEVYEHENDLVTLMKDQFANYVVQQAIETADPSQRRVLVYKMRPLLEHVRKFMYARHVVTKVDRIVTNACC